MICDRVKECAEKAQHMRPSEKAKKQSGKKLRDQKQKKEDLYRQPLVKPPCGDDERQSRCIDFLDNRSQIRCEENGKTYILDQSEEYPRHEVIKFYVDKGIISDPGAETVYKCDNVLLIRDSGTAILVELKGSETRHALKQLSATLNQKELQPLWNSQRRVFGRVVCRSSPPRIRNTDEFMDINESFFTRRGNIKIAEENMVEKYDEVEQVRVK